jgi:hypothetical protein
VLDTGDLEDVGAAEQDLARRSERPGREERARPARRDARSWDDIIRDKVPKWEVYAVLQGTEREAPVLAVPLDGRGVPIVLRFAHYHFKGDAYFTRVLKSGFVSVLDLQVILRELRAGSRRMEAIVRKRGVSIARSAIAMGEIAADLRGRLPCSSVE